jgi:hypothetical protein
MYEAGAELNVFDYDSRTPLHVASAAGLTRGAERVREREIVIGEGEAVFFFFFFFCCCCCCCCSELVCLYCVS